MRRAARALAILVTALLVAGCAGQQWGYDRPGVSAARYDHDLDACRKEAFRPQQFAITPSQRVDEEVVKRCMEHKGYRAVPL